jgi:hypothetical protein
VILRVFTHLVAASVGFWISELSRHHMLHAPVRVAHGRKIA